MEIIRDTEENERLLSFGDIKAGTVFELLDQAGYKEDDNNNKGYYMKLAIGENYNTNAVNMESGTAVHIEREEYVLIYGNAELHLNKPTSYWL